MSYYYVSTVQGDKGEHNVHTSFCTHGPASDHKKGLGYHISCASAVNEAKKTYPTADGCYYCSTDCHSK